MKVAVWGCLLLACGEVAQTSDPRASGAHSPDAGEDGVSPPPAASDSNTPDALDPGRPDAAVPPPGDSINATPRLSVGDFHTCLLGRSGEATCWGKDTSGQSDPPAGPFIALAAGQVQTCGLRPDETVTCWGRPEATHAPEGRFKAIGAGATFSCALEHAGGVQCWGDETLAPVPRLGGGPYASLSVGYAHVCALDAAGRPTCARGDPARDEGQAAAPPGPFVSLAAGGHFTCGAAASGEVTCWGARMPPPPGPMESLEAGLDHVCGRGLDGAIRCWGMSAGRHLRTIEDPVADFGAGQFDTCVVGDDERVVCHGIGQGEGGEVDFGQGTPPLPGAWPVDAVRESFLPFFEEGWFGQGAVGIITPEGPQLFFFAAPGRPLPTEDTIFEGVGFGPPLTGLLAEISRASDGLDYDATVQSLLPQLSIPTRGQRAMTLAHLLMRMSGLPQLSTADPRHAQADGPYSEERVGQVLGWTDLSFEPGTAIGGSDLGFGLAAWIVAGRRSMGFPELLERELTGPMGMPDTRVVTDAGQQARMAEPMLESEEHLYQAFDPGVLSGGTSVWTTARDMAALSRALLLQPEWHARVRPGMRTRFRDLGVAAVAVGWWASLDGQVLSAGSTNAGYSAYVALAPQHEVGIFVLASGPTYAASYLATIGVGLLRGRELLRPFVPDPRVEVDPEVLQKYAGSYIYPSRNPIVIEPGRGNYLRLLEGALPTATLIPTTQTRFHDRQIDRHIEFSVEADGSVQALVLQQGGNSYSFWRR